MPKPRRAGGFYDTPAWRALRLQALCRDNFRCVICQAYIGNPGQARVDHIQPLATHPHLALSLANLRSLCTLHDAHAHRERGPNRNPKRRVLFGGCDVTGAPLDPEHLWHKTSEKT